MGDRKCSVLFTSAGRRVELLNCFRHAGRALDLDMELIACDFDASLSSACHAADRSFNVPRCSDPSYVETVLDIARQNAVRLAVPTIDPDLGPLALATPQFASHGIRVHVGPPDVVAIARRPQP